MPTDNASSDRPARVRVDLSLPTKVSEAVTAKVKMGDATNDSDRPAKVGGTMGGPGSHFDAPKLERDDPAAFLKRGSGQPARGAKSGTTDRPADPAEAAELLATLKAAAEAAGFKVQPKPDAAFAPSYVELPEPLRVEVCPDCGLTFMVRLDWFLARAEKRDAIYCPAGHLIELKDVPADVTMRTARELLARVRTVETDNQRLRNTLERVPRLPGRPPTPEQMEYRFNWLANHARHTVYGQRACHFCGKQFKDQTNGRRHLKTHRAEVAALPVEHFDAP